MLQRSVRWVPVVLVLAAAGCAESYQVRRDRLLSMYPPGQTTRADVAKKWEPTRPIYSVTRPADGWKTLDDRYTADDVAASETRTGQPVYRVELYVGADGLFSLAQCWFFYDQADRVIDVDWRPKSD